MIPIVSVVGKSDPVKTTLLEKLIAELTQRNHKAASAKGITYFIETRFL